MGGAQVKSVTQVRLDELQVPQTSSKPGGDRQAVLLHFHCNRERDRHRQRDRQVRETDTDRLETDGSQRQTQTDKRQTQTDKRQMSQRETGYLDTLLDRRGCWFQQRWIVGRGWGW